MNGWSFYEQIWHTGKVHYCSVDYLISLLYDLQVPPHLMKSRWSRVYAPINVKPLGGGGGKPGIGGGFELSWEFPFKCPTPGHCGLSKKQLKVNKMLLEWPLKRSKNPTTGRWLLSNPPPLPGLPPQRLNIDRCIIKWTLVRRFVTATHKFTNQYLCYIKYSFLSWKHASSDICTLVSVYPWVIVTGNNYYFRSDE